MKRILLVSVLIIAFLLVGCKDNGTQQTPAPTGDQLVPQSEYAEMLREAIKTLYPDASYEPVTTDFRFIVTVGDESITVNTNNPYAHYALKVLTLEESLKTYSEAYAEYFAVEDRSLILLGDYIWPKFVTKEELSAAKDIPENAIIEDYNEKLSIIYVFDDSNGRQVCLTPPLLTVINVGYEPENEGELPDYKVRAINNVSQKLGELKIDSYNIDPDQVHTIAVDDKIQTAILMANIWDKSTLGIEGEIIIALPAKDFLMYFSSEAKAAFPYIDQYMQDKYNEASPDKKFLNTYFQYTDGKFVPVDLEFTPLPTRTP